MHSTQLDEVPFATDRSGQSWPETLSSVPDWKPDSRTLAVVAPHPNDETLGAGGLISLCAELGYEITIILVTDGEAARPEQPSLAERRVDELRAALKCIAPDGAHVARLQFPDGEVAACEAALTHRLFSVVPLDCTLVAPCEYEGHADYTPVSRAAQAAARKLHVPCVQYPMWTGHRDGRGDLEPQKLGRVALSATAQEAKRRAIRCYRSQLEERSGGALASARALAEFERPYEVFVL